MTTQHSTNSMRLRTEASRIPVYGFRSAAALLLAVWSLVPFMPSIQAADGPAATELAKWKQVVAARRSAQIALESIEASFSQTFRLGPEDQPETQLQKECHFAINHERVYFRAASHGTNSRWETEAAFDGSIARKRDSRSPDVLFKKHDTQIPIITSRLPHDVIEYITPDQLEEWSMTGRATLLSAEHALLDEVDCIRVVWRLHSQPLPEQIEQMVVWYDIQHGYLPIRTEVYNARGDLTKLRDQIQLRGVTIDGNILYYPITGQLNLYRHGQSNARWHFTVDMDSLRINALIPDSRFILDPLPEERVYDADLGMFVSEQQKKDVTPQME